MKFLKIALAGAAAMAAISAHAQAQGFQPGPYMGIGFGNARYHGPDIGGLPTDRTSGGGKIWGGWDFMPNLAAELSYTDLGKTGSPAADAKVKGISIDAVGKWPFTPELYGFARIGAFWSRGETSLDTTDRSTKLKYGLGLQYDFNRQVGVRGEYERYDLDLFNHDVGVDLYTIGVNYKF